MVQLLRFRTRRFDPAAEDPNPINPIPGQALLLWLCDGLRADGYAPTEPDTEDWGWYIRVTDAGFGHLIGASGEPSLDATDERPDGDVDQVEEIDWAIQIHRNRGLLDRLRGKNQLGPDAPLVVAVEKLLRAQPDFSELERE